MDTLNENFQKIAAAEKHSPEILAACRRGEFWVVAIPRLMGGYSIGTIDEGLPCLFPTEAEAIADNALSIQDYTDEIAEGDRDADDEWEGRVLMCRWDGECPNMTLYDQGEPVAVGNWKTMAGG